MKYFIIVSIICFIALQELYSYELQETKNVTDMETKTVESKPIYKLVYQARNWTDAKEACLKLSKKSHLAIPRSQKEFQTIQSLVRALKYGMLQNADYKLIAWIGVHSLHDSYTWQSVNGENMNEVGFNLWASNKDESEDNRGPRCAGVDAVNTGYRDWWCYQRLPYICQLNNK